MNTLFHIIKEVLECDDTRALDILLIRVASNDTMANCVNEPLCVDEALEVVGPRDAKANRKEQAAGKDGAVSRETFIKDFRRKLIEKSGVKKLVPKSVVGKALAKALAARLPVPARVTQQEAKAWLPPGSSVWRALGPYAWGGHCPPRPRISEPWASDANAALCRSIQRLWGIRLVMRGETWDACPHTFRRSGARVRVWAVRTATAPLTILGRA